MDSYEKKYKEALARAREIHFSKDEMEYIFPELKENEDERIRKWLEEHIEAMPDNSIEFKDVKRIDVLHWLEKQGEQKLAEGTFVNVDDVREDFIQEVYRVLDADPTNDRANQIIDAFDNLPTVTIEKQGEHKPQSKSAVETIKEEKVDNADKVEPKIKIGDWVVKKDGGLFANENHYVRITDIDKERYWFDSETWLETKYIRLWTIQDAKECDILVYDNSIFIFNEIYNHYLIYYGIYEDNKIRNDKYYSFLDLDTIDINNIHPATKEQRDTLEKAMADAGYTFDFEKKKLKKIEDEAEIPFGAKDSELQEDTYYIPKGFHAEIDGDKVVIKKGEKPTEWSEVDENIKQWIISDIDKLFCLNKKSSSLAGKEIEWLKSLKYRVGCAICTTTKECGEEDEVILDEIIDFFENGTVKLQHDLSLYASWLKSLKNRYTWKPSDEQMDALQYVCRNLNPPFSDKLGWDSLKTLELLYKILKKLK